MSKNKYWVRELQVKVNGEDITVDKIVNDRNGNPRYVVHFLSIGAKDYDDIPGLKKYRAKWYGGGYVFSSYHVEEYLQFLMKRVKEYYNK